MRSLRTLVFGSAFAAALVSGAGCALTNYELITDTEGDPVNTLGSAYVKQDVQFASVWPDGNDNLIWYVDQRRNGDRKLYTVNYFTPPDHPDPYKDDQYCQPDWLRCRITTADDPEVGDADEFDYRENTRCPGHRSLILLTSATRELGECGRLATVTNAAKMIGLAAGMNAVKVSGKTWLQKTLSASNTSIVLDNRVGGVYRVPLNATATVRANFAKRQVLLDLTNPDMKDVLLDAIAWSSAHPSPNGLVATLTIDGVDLTYRVKFARGAAEAVEERYR